MLNQNTLVGLAFPNYIQDRMTSIPLVARAAVLEELGKPLVFHSDWPVKKPSELLPGQCLVKIDYTGLLLERQLL